MDTRGHGGHKGTQGAQGDRGDTRGHRGHRGHKGTQWTRRAQGDTRGHKGTRGIRGTRGTKGDTRGHRGHKGIKGTQGTQGDYFRYGPNACSHNDEKWQKPIHYVTLDFRDRRGAALLRYRNRAKITVFMCERKTFLVWFS